MPKNQGFSNNMVIFVFGKEFLNRQNTTTHFLIKVITYLTVTACLILGGAYFAQSRDISEPAVKYTGRKIIRRKVKTKDIKYPSCQLSVLSVAVLLRIQHVREGTYAGKFDSFFLDQFNIFSHKKGCVRIAETEKITVGTYQPGFMQLMQCGIGNYRYRIKFLV